MSLFTGAARRRVAQNAVILDAVTEWWISPVATYDAANNRTVGGAVSGDRGGNARVLAWETNHSTGSSLQYEVATVPVDDHNAPALWYVDGRRPVITWTKHNGDQILHIKTASADGDLSSLATAPDQGITVPGGSSYTQIYRIESLSTSAVDVFWVFIRLLASGWRWGIQEFSVDQATGTVTAGAYRPFFATGTAQSYATTADAHAETGNQTIRVAAGYNPTAAYHAIHAFEIDTVTGEVTSLGNPSLVANVITGTGIEIPLLDQEPVIEERPFWYSRRLFYPRPGPASWAIAYAEWDINFPDDAVYKIAEPGTPWNVTDLGIVSGPRVGHIASSGYIGGVAFRNPCSQNDPFLVASKVAAGESIVQEVDPDTLAAQTIDASETVYLMRPMSPVGGGPLRSVHSGFTSYADYTDYSGNVYAAP